MAENPKLFRRNTSVPFLVVLSIMLLLFVVFISWYVIHWTNEQKENQRSNYLSSLSILKEFENDTSKIIKITPEQLKEINIHIDALSDKANEETQHDIDWINTFTAFGIGLLAIIGGLLPIIINFLSKEHLEKKIEAMGAEVNDTKTLVATANAEAKQADNNAKNALEQLTGFDSKVSNLNTILNNVSGIVSSNAVEISKTTQKVETAISKLPYITALVLQNAVARLISIDNIRYYTETNRAQKLSKVLNGIKSALEQCENDEYQNLSDENFKYLIAIIIDFKIGLQFGPLRYSMPKNIQKQIDDYAVYLNSFKIENKANFKELFQKAASDLDSLSKNVSAS